MSAAAQRAAGQAEEAASARPRVTDWLHHDLVVSGPAGDVAAFQAAAAGCGAIPWRDPDPDAEEERRMWALVSPPDGTRGLRVAEARVLAGLLRTETERSMLRVEAAIERGSTACPLDLHKLIPVPQAMLALGPDDPASLAWLRTHWGVTQALRRVERLTSNTDRRLRRSAKLHVRFVAADWTPWAALRTLRARWPSLVLDMRPRYDRG